MSPLPLALSAVLFLGCGVPPVSSLSAPASLSARASATAAPLDTVALLARPLAAAARGSTCIPTPISSDTTRGIGSPRGDGYFSLGGPAPTGGDPFNKMVYVMRSTTSSGVLRGVAIGGTGTIRFSGTAAAPGEAGDVRSTPSGSWTFYSAVVVSRSDALYVYPSAPGCYALQIDGSDFEEVVVIEAR